jgi:hypothetical protein
MFDAHTRTLFCGDLLTHAGNRLAPVTESDADVWEASEAMRVAFPYAALREPQAHVEQLAATNPQLLATMHGSSYRGDGAALLRRLGRALGAAA